MRKRATRKSSAAALLVSPPPPPSASATATRSPSPAEFPAAQFDFNLNEFAGIASSLKKKSNKNGASGASGSKRIQPTGFSPSPQRSLKNVNTIADLKELASSNLNSVKHHLEKSHSEILKDMESSKSRLHKRYKIQTQDCQRVMDEAEKEYKKMYDRINEGREAMKASYAEFISEAQATASRQFQFVKHPSPSLQRVLRKTYLRSRTVLGSHQLQLDNLEVPRIQMNRLLEPSEGLLQKLSASSCNAKIVKYILS
ncbi:hypothetical protein C2S53_002621 [Perilla frutescens var. hirtella]|uniref:Uncharacterized protein n=1 Tax=Perilla frutescens var. hirtella TaxID=608512 RepID=A0AAD4NYK2_PERFH|nr:hypothetical protein C2S53_002621 [Perilla frutescens var. hirtella]